MKEMTDFSKYTFKDVKNMRDINQRDKSNFMTPLMYACEKLDYKTCVYLFSKNVNYLARETKDGFDAFYHLATNTSWKERVVAKKIAKLFYNAGFRIKSDEQRYSAQGISCLDDINEQYKDLFRYFTLYNGFDLSEAIN